MILAVDIGNSNTVLGCIEDGRVVKTRIRIRTERDATSAEYAIKLIDILNLLKVDPHSFEGAIMSSVVPEASGAFSEAVNAVAGIKCLVVGPGVKTGLNVRIDDPGTLGCDLLVGGVAAMEYYGCPAIVIDMGTATTVTVVDAEGSFRGGAIMPGVKLGLSALAAGTSLLPDISLTAPRKCVGTNTVDCMRSGAVFGTAAMIDGLVSRMQKELTGSCTVVATGGLAPFIVKHCSHEIICDDDLLLKGLWAIWQRNNK